jgi:sodium transport system permease protein
MSNSTQKRANLSRVFVVYRKEMRETLRDKRVLFGVFISPLVITPLLFFVMGYFFSQKAVQDKAETLTVAVVKSPESKPFLDALGGDATLKIVEVANIETARTGIQQRTYRAALAVPDTAKTQLERGETVKLEAYFDPSNEKSSTALKRIQETLKIFNQKTLTDRLVKRGISETLLKPTEVESKSVASEKSVGGLILSTILPYVIVLTGAFGGMTSAFDLGAGEKERGTMETLLVSPASRTEIILGKLLTIETVSVLSALFSIIGIIATFSAGLAYFGEATRGKIAISYGSVGIMALMVIPLTLLTSSLLLVVSAFARNQKEAQAYVLPFMIVVILPAMMSFALGAESPRGLSLVPILNCALVIKQVMTNATDFVFLALSLGSSTLYAGAALVLCVALFNREEIIFRS